MTYVEANRLFKIREAADYMGLHYITLWRRVKAGSIPATRVGRGYRLSGTSINHYLTENEVPSGVTH